MPDSEIHELGSLVLTLLAVLTVVGLVFLLLNSIARSRQNSSLQPRHWPPTSRPRLATTSLEKDDRLIVADQRVGLSEQRRPVRPSETDGTLVPVAAFASAAEANALRERLRTAGIAATVVGATALRTERTAVPGVELHVAEADAEATLALLDELDGDARDPTGADEEIGVPREKAGDLVTVATYDSPIEAQLGLARVEAAGIRAILADAQLVAMDWVMSAAIGGIKLQVMGVDAPAAVRVLAETVENARKAAAFAEIPEDEEEPPNERETTAERAVKGAMLGILLWPIQFYIAGLLLAVVFSPQRLRPQYRQRAILAAVLCIPFVVVMLLPVAILVASAGG